jgi:hypothetical protein
MVSMLTWNHVMVQVFWLKSQQPSSDLKMRQFDILKSLVDDSASVSSSYRLNRQKINIVSVPLSKQFSVRTP